MSSTLPLTDPQRPGQRDRVAQTVGKIAVSSLTTKTMGIETHSTTMITCTATTGTLGLTTTVTLTIVSIDTVVLPCGCSSTVMSVTKLDLVLINF